MEDTTQTSKESMVGDRLSHQKEWLVKVNGRILGPYTFDEVSQLLNNHNLVSHDEIVQPRGRWKMIRHEEKFREVLNEIRNRQASRGEQILDSTFGGSITVTEGVTATTELLDDGFRNTSKLIKDFDEQVKRPQGEERSSSETEVESRDLSKSYAAKNDPKAQRKFKKAETIKIAIALAVFILTGIFSLVKFSFPHKEGGKTRLDAFSEAMNQGELYERLGEQAKAIAAYNEARNLKASDINMLIHLAPLTFLYEKQSLQANRMFKQVLEGAGENADYKKRSYMGLGLVALDSHELDVAHENFTKVLNLDPQNTAASFNIGIINYYKDKYEDAEAYILKALEKGGGDGAVVISMANVNIASEHNNKLVAAHSMFRAYLEVSLDYRTQVLIQDARVLSILGRSNEATKNLEQALDADPDDSDSFVRNWNFYRGMASWDQTMETLKKTIPSLNPSARLTALSGLVMYQGRDKLEGAQTIEKALTQDPKDPLLMALAGWVEMKLGRREAAVANIKEAALANPNYKLPKILRAKLCMEEKDFECAQKYWQEVLKMDQKNLSAYHGLASLAWANKDTSGAVKWLRQGQAMDQRFTPFMVLNYEIEQTQSQQSASAATGS